MGKDKIPVLVSIRENNLGEESIFIFDPLFKLAHKYLKKLLQGASESAAETPAAPAPEADKQVLQSR